MKGSKSQAQASSRKKASSSPPSATKKKAAQTAPMSESSSTSSGSSAGARADVGHTDGYVDNNKHEVYLRGVSRDFVTPPNTTTKSSGAKSRGSSAGKASGGRAKSADDVLGDEPAERSSGNSSRSSSKGAPIGRLPSFDPNEETELGRATKKRFGDKVGPVIHAHLHIMGVDTEDDLRFVDAKRLMSTAETSGLKQVQIVKLQDWVNQAQQVNADLEVRFATSLLSQLHGEKSLSAANLERWANKAATNLAREFSVLKAEADTAREGGVTMLKDTGRLESAAVIASPISSALPSASPSERELILRELGSPGGKDELEMKQKAPGCLMANPSSIKRMAWDFVLIMPCLAYLTIVMPFRMCLGNEPIPDSPVFYLEMAMDFVFIVDIFVNFRTGFIDDATNLIVYDYYSVAMNYLRTWFVLDVVSGIPFGLLDIQQFRKIAFIKVLKSSRILKAVKLLRFLKLSRLIKGLGIMNRIEPEVVDRIEDFLAEGATKTALRISRILLIMLFTAHFMACAWILASRMNGDLHPEEASWISTDEVVLDADYTMTEAGSSIVMDIYLAAFYYSFTTMTTVGYGDITPKNSTERIFAICLETLGGFMYAYVISSLTSIVTMEDANAKHTRERLDAVASYISKMELPQDLGRRVRRYFRARKSEAMDEATILTDLSPSLRGEVSTFLVEGGFLADVVLFKQMNAVFWPRILPILRPTPLMRGEVICKEGEDCIEAFIVVDGELLGTTRMDGGNFDDDGTGSDAGSPLSNPNDDIQLTITNGGGEGGGGAVNTADAAPVPMRRRRIKVGQMVDPLCLVKVWDKSLEKVVAMERTDSYAVTAETFYNTFVNDEKLFRSLQEFVVRTQFEMDESPESKTEGREFGVPMYALNDEESKVKEAMYLADKAARRKEKHKHQRGANNGNTSRKMPALGVVYEDEYAGGQEGAPGAQARL